MLEQLMTPEIIILGGVLSCAFAVLTLILAGRTAYIKGLASRHAALEFQIAERQKILSDVGQKVAELSEIEKKVSHAENRFAALQHDLKPIEEKHLKAMSDYEDTKAKLREAREEWTKLREKVDLYKDRVAKVDTLEQEVKQLSDQKDQLAELAKKVPERLKKYNQLKKAIEDKSDELDGLKKTIKKIAEKQTEANETLNATRKKIQACEDEFQRRKDELKRLENTRIDLDARVETLSEKLKKVGRMPPEAFESLEASVFSEIGNVRTDDNEEKAIQRLNQLVEFCGFEIPIRLQDAFHTALKTSDISCLTVMAGVSGTGKSAFPKLYSQAMGIHFLPLAVEPRWDSPHDLFGFLNYMENRFEATTLGRALVQFNNSPYAPAKQASLKDQILLVLLDEMNLARIEYYFSEFLSKLEMRRNTNIENEEDYRVVSVEVFPGYAGDGKVPPSPAVRLYSGSNVIFVGTMNEDESTQTLSDKVIDRANVLYFGRPNRLHGMQQKMIYDKDWRPLTEQIWRAWIVDAGVETIPSYEHIENLINNINQTLSLIGRPFGWRTYKAIQSYIANHPAVRFRQDSGMRPLSDQIAMRVMPKLRGVDLSEHGEIFNNLGQLLQQVNDPALQQEFDHARQSSQGFFDWRGINWDQ
jgi:predicted  nucleic acid-binding Zn-ribbon protein